MTRSTAARATVPFGRLEARVPERRGRAARTRWSSRAAPASDTGRSVNLLDHVRRLYAGLKTGRATDRQLNLEAVAYAPVGASSAFSVSPLPAVSVCFLRSAQ